MTLRDLQNKLQSAELSFKELKKLLIEYADMLEQEKNLPEPIVLSHEKNFKPKHKIG